MSSGARVPSAADGSVVLVIPSPLSSPEDHRRAPLNRMVWQSLAAQPVIMPAIHHSVGPPCSLDLAPPPWWPCPFAIGPCGRLAPDPSNSPSSSESTPP